MPKFLIIIISYALGSFVLRMFAALGIGIFTYKGLYSLVEGLLDLIEPTLSQLPSSILDILSIAGVPEGLSIITSAVLTRAAIKSVSTFIGVTS